MLDPLHAAQFGVWAPLWTILHEPGALPFGLPGGVSYPVLPWIGIMALGYGLGPVFLEPATERARQLTLLGLAAIALFCCCAERIFMATQALGARNETP